VSDDEEIPFAVISNEELERAPRMKAGDEIICQTCSEKHVIESRMSQVRKDDGAMVPGTLEFLFYRCGSRMYMAGLDGKSVPGTIRAQRKEKS